jgi:glycolate oxidase FAD binding subunit
VAISVSAVKDALTAAVGASFLRDDSASRASHATDGVLPRWVAFPGNVLEVSDLLKVAQEERLALVPWGSGARSGLGNPPTRLDLALNVTRLSGLFEYSPDDLTVTVGAGTTLETLARHLTTRRQFLPLDPLDGPRRTVGGVVATDSSGPVRFRYGTARDLLLGVRFVQPDGTVTWGGAKVVKSVSGYDMPKLMVGSLGTLAVLGELTFRLHPAPETERSWLIPFDSLDRAGALVQRILDSSLQPNRLELLNRGALRAMARAEDAGAAVALAIGSVREAVESQGRAVLALARSLGGDGHEVAHSDFWSGLGRILHTERDEQTLLLRVATLIDRVGLGIAELERMATACGFRLLAVAEAGNGVLHARLSGLLAPREWSDSVITPLRERLALEGGSCVLEEGPRRLKDQLDVWGPVDPGAFAIMERLKHAFDPHSLLNPGRFIGRL